MPDTYEDILAKVKAILEYEDGTPAWTWIESSREADYAFRCVTACYDLIKSKKGMLDPVQLYINDNLSIPHDFTVKIQAIKMHRELYDSSLREAKEAVDEMIRNKFP